MKNSLKFLLSILVILVSFSGLYYFFGYKHATNIPHTIPSETAREKEKLQDTQTQAEQTKICENTHDCTQKWDVIAEKLFGENGAFSGAHTEMAKFNALLLNEEELQNIHTHTNDENENDEDNEDMEDPTILVTMWVLWNDISFFDDEENFLTDEEKNESLDVWNIFQEIVPENWRTQLNYYVIHSGSSTMAYIDGSENKIFWYSYDTLGVNLPDFKNSEQTNILTLIHEFSHLFSLSDSQQGHSDIFCYFNVNFECLYNGSYLLAFYKNFWEKFDEKFILKEDLSDKEKQEFFENNKTEFLNSYASGNPFEDFAESFTVFVITPHWKLNENSIIDQKQLFFYNYPELVTLRLEILKNIENITLNQ